MDFINKLIKKGIFGLVLCFSFFAIFAGEKVGAAGECKINILNDGEYLVLNEGVGWSDSGANVICGSGASEVTHKDISVSINGSEAVTNSVSGQYVSDSYVTTAGFYAIKYSWISDETVTITRYVRVLPANLNAVGNVWVGDFSANTTGDDTFVKVADHKGNFIAVGNFGTSAYVAYFESTGKYLWHTTFANTELKDIISSGDASGNIYYIAGKNANGGLVKAIQLNADVGINSGYDLKSELADVTVFNKIVLAGSDIYAAGYKANTNGTRTGKIAKLTHNVLNVTSFENIAYAGSHAGVGSYEYNSVIVSQSQEDGSYSVIAVGNADVSGKNGATGGIVASCNLTLVTCSWGTPELWSNGNSNTTTNFNDVIEVENTNYYLVVGQTRITSFYSGEDQSGNAESAIVALLDSDLKIIDGGLRGHVGFDALYSIRKIAADKYVAVGEKSGEGLYLDIGVTVKVDSVELVISENSIVGLNGSLQIRDVLIKKGVTNTSELAYVFIGSTTAGSIGGIPVKSIGAKDAFIVTYDKTEFKNFENINVLQGSAICSGGGTSCEASGLDGSYKMLYGAKLVDVSATDQSGNEATISSATVQSYSVFHKFTNEQGVNFIIGKKINITATPVAPDLSVNEQGIDKWYLYDRYENIGVNTGLKTRKTLWTERYFPVENNKDKETGVTYYVLEYNGTSKKWEFAEDEGSRTYTYNNYIQLKAEPLQSNVAFQSKEKLEEYALLQEFARVAFVNEKYTFAGTGITAFENEGANLTRQDYYFVYYIDLEFSNSLTCGTINAVELTGRCNSYTGYAFSSLNKIKEIATLITTKYDSFKIERNEDYIKRDNINLPSNAYFKEELSTIRYEKTAIIDKVKLKNGLSLEVSYYAVDGSNPREFVATPVVSSITNKDAVVFAAAKDGGDYTEEGKYVVRYCYNYVTGGPNVDNCGSSITFVIDRTTPVVKYKMLDETYGSIDSSWDKGNPYPIGYSMTIQDMIDIDPYAYIIVNKKNYYLQCNSAVGSKQCLSDLETYVRASYSYDKDNPNKVFNIKVSDRAGNITDAHFRIGTDKPGMSITPSVDSNSFSLTIDFYGKNKIQSFGFYFTSSEICDADTPCTNDAVIQSAIKSYIDALIFNNEVLIERAKTDPTINLDAQLVKNYVFQFHSSDLPNGGIVIPIPTKTIVDGVEMYTFTDPDTPYLVTDGLYEFTLYDEFNNTINAFAGIGLDKAELEININSDYMADEVEWDDENGKYIYHYETKIPVPEDQIGHNPDYNMVFPVRGLQKYAFAVPEDIKNGFNTNMYFTNRFVYLKIKATEFGIVRIMKANTLNIVGGYGVSDETNSNLSCLFKIYGSQTASKVGTCNGGTLVPYDEIENGVYRDAFEAQGIYITNKSDGYYYLVITQEGVYDIWSEVRVTVESGGKTQTIPTIPVYYSFTVDRSTPEIDLEISCASGATCKGEKAKDAFAEADFKVAAANQYKYNIGNFDINYKINLDQLIGGAANRLLAIKIDGPESIASTLDQAVANKTLACNPYRTPCNVYEFASFKDVLKFDQSGVYTITFYDGVYDEVKQRDPISGDLITVHTYANSVSYTFIIDKDAPSIIEIVDANGKEFDEFQQYIDVKLSINEGSFLVSKDGDTMLTLTYHIEGLSQQTITVANSAGSCVLSTGSFDEGECSVLDRSGGKTLLLDIIIPINKTDKQSGDKYLVLNITDYFGNKMSDRQVFYFDNQNPYIYYSNSYTPILKFGSEVTADEMNKMLSTDANAELGTFACGGENGIVFTVGIDEVETVIMYCGDTPQITGVENNVRVETYEAYRVAFNNYFVGANNTLTLLPNGTPLKVTDTVYKKPFKVFTSKIELESHIGEGKDVYVPGAFIEVSSLDKVDPNEKYYLDSNGLNSVKINDLYTNAADYASCSTSTTSKCVLYNMYVNNGDFSKLSDNTLNPSGHKYYVYDNKGYRTTSAVVLENYMNYYQESEGAPIVDDGKYLPALTLANSCVKVSGGNCTLVAEGRIKVINADVEYRNIIKKMDTTNTNYPDTSGIIVATSMTGGTTEQTVLDNRIWQIAYEGGNPVKFGFGLASNLGRPIIFAAIDGAGNMSANRLETVIAIKDTINPEISLVHKMYELDNSAAHTEGNYIKETRYYRLVSIPEVSACATSTSKYFRNDGGVYNEVACTSLVDGTQYYVSSDVYVPVADGMEKEVGVDYYKRKAGDDLGTNYLTSDNMVVEFSEPIYKIQCSYYLYDNSGSVAQEHNYDCGFNNIEFDYGDNKRSFYLEFNYDLGALNPNYFVHYNITVWDFSNNPNSFGAFYIDREKPVILFNSNVTERDNVEVVYNEGASDESKYNHVYLTNDFLKETLSKDSINNRISGDASQINEFSYSVKYYEFNYDITYKNYIYEAGAYKSVDNGLSKTNDVRSQVYVLIKKPTDYVLKGNTGECITKADGEYCYIEDDYNYYPALVSDTDYWKELGAGEYIKNSSVRVYKIEYILYDYSGNISDTLIKTVYCVDRVTPTLIINNVSTTNKYGYHIDANLKFENEKEAYFYIYKCKDAVTTCELPSEIFAQEGASLKRYVYPVLTSPYERLYNEESIYKLYFHDRGYYVPTLNGDGDNIETLKYNHIEYTFLIDRTDPYLYLDANKDGDKLYYSAHLDKEETLYCVNGSRFADDLQFKDYIECKNTPVFAGEWKNDSDFVNMMEVYEYNDGTNTYKLSVANGSYILYKNVTPYLLEYVSATQYEYVDVGGGISYVLTIEGENYKLNINDAGDVGLTLTYSYRDTINNVDYKYIIDGEDHKLYINEVEHDLTFNNGIYEYKDTINYISYSIRLRNGMYQIRVTNESVITRQLYNSRGLLIYEERYEKIAPNAQKYFYNTYYKYENGEFRAYAIGSSYDENNVYIITSINVFFREDGKYLLMAKDKSGNDAGRRLAGIDYDADYSSFVVDNTAPHHNKEENAPTGINYWYSVPSTVVDTTEEAGRIISLTKADGEVAYNIDNSGLNNANFYAFATKIEAEMYLTSLYSAHINSLEDNTCTKNGKKGFGYTYYNPNTQEIIGAGEAEGCFVGTGGKSNKSMALDKMKVLAKQLIFETFAPNKMFNDSSIQQKVCTSSECGSETGMYKSVYLKVDHKNDTKTVSETCTSVMSATEHIECIKVSAKMIKDDTQNGNSVSFEIGGENTKDTSKIVVYSKSTNLNASTNRTEFTTSSTIALTNNSYYIFEEVDTLITYTNYPAGGEAYLVEHSNTSYYAIYIDNNDYIDVHYKVGLEPGSGDGNNLTASGQGVVRTNVDNYSLIIKNNGDSNFENNYEIYVLRDALGNIIEVYSYLILEIDGQYYNLNDPRYKRVNGSEYYFEIPMASEKFTRVAFIDRTGTRTQVDVSISKIAPSLEVVYNGEGGTQTVNLSIMDTILTKTVTESVEILYSPNGVNYKNDKTQDILKALLCKSGTSGLVYDCINTGAANGVNNYRVIIRNLQHLYGFFKVNLADNHGNTNSIEFIYNPADMSADYSNITKFISNEEIAQFVNQEMRMITNEHVQLEFNNEINYVILYKIVNGEPVVVCNTKSITDGACDENGNTLNKVSRITDAGGNYTKSILYYTEEGMYTAKIINRASETIYAACFTTDGNGQFVVSEECKKVVTYRGACSWDNNADFCDDPMEVITSEVNKVNGTSSYNKVEVDKSLPIVNTDKFTITSPSGEEDFVNNGVYKNAEVTIKWEEELVQLRYTCEYLDSALPCNGNSTGFYVNQYSFTAKSGNEGNKTKYTFWLEDFAGNSTVNNAYSFTIEVVPPTFEIYEVDENGAIIEENQVERYSTITSNIKLLCRLEGSVTDCDVYKVKLYEKSKVAQDSWNLIGEDLAVINISLNYNEDKTYRYMVYVKNIITGAVYENIWTEFIFTIDKKPPTITVSNEPDMETGLYKGEVEVSLADVGLGVIYSGCKDTGTFDEFGDKIYDCSSATEYTTFTDTYVLQETNIYMIIAYDEWGNVTKEKDVKYISIDNETPTFDIFAKGEYVDYVIPEGGFTNKEVISVQVKDNNTGSYLKYRIKDVNDQFGEWMSTKGEGDMKSLDYFEFTAEGFYEVIPVDAIGNEGTVRHFIIDRTAPNYKVLLGEGESEEDVTSKNSILETKFKIVWSNSSLKSYESPIIKVTHNGKVYKSGEKIEGTGEHVFVITDLAGNVVIDKRTLNKGNNICLNNVNIKPKKIFEFEVGPSSVIDSSGYKFSENDVIIFAVNAYYFGGSNCAAETVKYKSITADSYFVVGSYANHFNTSKQVSVNLGDEMNRAVDGFAYAIVVSEEVAKRDLDLPIGENFFTKDPIGWSLIFVTGALIIYVGVRLIFFRKKVKVLK